MSQEFARHGSDPTGVGFNAAYAGYALDYPATLAPSRWRPYRWDDHDHLAYLEVMAFERRVDQAGLPADLAPGVRQELQRDLSAIHGALPYNEAERRLILDTHRSDESDVRAIGTVTLVHGGIETKANGHELMRRWYLWRRGLKQFDGQHGPELARDALQRFAARLISESVVFYEGLKLD